MLLSKIYIFLECLKSNQDYVHLAILIAAMVTLLGVSVPGPDTSTAACASVMTTSLSLELPQSVSALSFNIAANCRTLISLTRPPPSEMACESGAQKVRRGEVGGTTCMLFVHGAEEGGGGNTHIQRVRRRDV